ncbi:MAG: type II toxin-antitoxin system RelE/ParE family toxin [Defluviitaleaceae bacterium]|nr:type II toxin-antitoxin system RelE/ParE family toxin [Defluviitaleaceae bacterium]
MRFKLGYTDSFRADAAQIVFNLREYPKKARRILAKTKKAASLLRLMPHMHPVCRHNPNYRMIVIEDYLAFYSVDEEKGLVEVRRLLYGKMNISERLNL